MPWLHTNVFILYFLHMDVSWCIIVRQLSTQQLPGLPYLCRKASGDSFIALYMRTCSSHPEEQGEKCLWSGAPAGGGQSHGVVG